MVRKNLTLVIVDIVCDHLIKARFDPHDIRTHLRSSSGSSAWWNSLHCKSLATECEEGILEHEDGVYKVPGMTTGKYDSCKLTWSNDDWQSLKGAWHQSYWQQYFPRMCREVIIMHNSVSPHPQWLLRWKHTHFPSQNPEYTLSLSAIVVFSLEPRLLCLQLFAWSPFRYGWRSLTSFACNWEQPPLRKCSWRRPTMFSNCTYKRPNLLEPWVNKIREQP